MCVCVLLMSIPRRNSVCVCVCVQAMAVDDPDLIRWFTDSDKENETPPTASVAKQQGQSSSVMDECSQDSIPDDIPFCDGE